MPVCERWLRIAYGYNRMSWGSTQRLVLPQVKIYGKRVIGVSSYDQGETKGGLEGERMSGM